jgi:hypothetical protein
MSYRSLLSVVMACLPLVPVIAAEPGFDRYGGWKAVRFTAGGFFRIHFDGQRWWLVTPEGNAFLSIGVNHITPYGDAIRRTGVQPYHQNVLARHKDIATWTAFTRDRLRAWGFNTLGCWSGGEIRDTPRTVGLNFAAGSGGDWLMGGLPDFFSPAFVNHAAKLAESCKAQKDDPWLVGYFLDNELAWSPDWRPVKTLFDRYASLPAKAPGKQAWCRLLKEHYTTCEAFNAAWAPSIQTWDDLPKVKGLTPRPGQADATRRDRDAFSLVAARQYFQTCTRAIRAVDPNHLILGCRFVGWPVPGPVVQACGESCDVVSINFYELGLVGELVYRHKRPTSDAIMEGTDHAPFYRVGGKPLMITEFSFRSMDSGMPNTYPPPLAVQPNVPTQQIRAERYTRYVNQWMSQPFFVGYHWFEWADEPVEGRFDGENGNYGLVNIRDDPYDAFVAAVTRVNHKVWALHRASAAPQGSAK